MIVNQQITIAVTVNGQICRAAVEPRYLLSDFLRHTLGLTGTRVGCEHGICGACTVLLNGRAVRSCLMFAVQSDGCSITTVEGLAPEPGQMHPLQAAFRNNHAVQCGFCTAGMLITATELLANNVSPSRAEIREAISGNLCRCTGYSQILDAIEEAARQMRFSREEAAQ